MRVSKDERGKTWCVDSREDRARNYCMTWPFKVNSSQCISQTWSTCWLKKIDRLMPMMYEQGYSLILGLNVDVWCFNLCYSS